MTAPRRVCGVRDTSVVAFQRAMSNGPIARRLGWFAIVLLPLLWLPQLVTVLLDRGRVWRLGRASVAFGPRHRRHGPAATVAVLMGHLVATMMVLAPLLVVLVIVVNYATILGWCVVATLLFELGWDVGLSGTRSLVRRPPRQERTGAIPLDTLVAFPRRDGAGSGLVRALQPRFGAADRPVVLTARTDGLVAFYSRFGFVSDNDRDARRMVYGDIAAAPRPR